MSGFGRLFKEFGSLSVGFLRSALKWLLYDQFYTDCGCPGAAVADSFTVVVGTVTGSLSNTYIQDGVDFIINELTIPGPAFDVHFTFPVDGTATSLRIYGHYQGNPAHTVNVDAYNGGGWDNLGVLPSVAGDALYTFALLAGHTIGGVVTIRIQHISNGAAGHFCFLDYMGVVNPKLRTCEPGPGTLHINDTESKISISDSRLIFSGGLAVPGYAGDPGIFDNVIRNREAGIALYARDFNKPTKLNSAFIGWAAHTGIVPTVDALYLNAANISYWYGGAIYVTGIEDYSAGIDYDILFGMRNLGGYVIIKGGAFSDWTLLWVGDANYNIQTHASIGVYDQPLSIETFGVIDLPANNFPVFDHRDLDTTSYTAGAVATGYKVATADCKISFDVTNATANQWIMWRRVDTPTISCMWLKCDVTSGNYKLETYIAPTATTLASGGAYALNDHVDIVVNGDNVKVFLNYNPTPIINYSSASLNVNIAQGYFTKTAPATIANLRYVTLDGIANEDSENFPGYGFATEVIPGPIAAGTAYIHEANHWREWALNTLPAVGQIEDWFRSPAVTVDGWRVTINTAGDVDLDEIVAGIPTQRATSAGAVVGGERIVIIPDGQTIRARAYLTQLFNYAAAVTNQTITVGEIETLGTGGEISNLIVYPRRFSEAPLTKGATQVRQALALIEQDG